MNVKANSSFNDHKQQVECNANDKCCVYMGKHRRMAVTMRMMVMMVMLMAHACCSFWVYHS